MWSDVVDVGFFHRSTDKGGLSGVVVTLDTGHDQFLAENHIQLMQFTGLRDKNGKEIFEGDVTTSNKQRGTIVGLQSGLVYMDVREYEAFKRGSPVIIYEAVADNQTSSYLESCEVIGNIYENPELLK
jgi:uncharacterized phage protein (TIGR01671 family)